MRPDPKAPRRSGPCPRTRTTQKHRGNGPLLQGRQQRGFGLGAAMFLIIVVAGAIAAMWRMSVTQTATSSLSLQQARAYQAARAGLEWGIARAIAGQPAKSSFSPEGFKGFVVTVAEPTQPSEAAQIQEEGKNVTFHRITATAQYATVGSPDYVYRKLTAVVEMP